MKIKELLSPNTSDNKVKIYDTEDRLIYTGDIYGAVREYGDFTVKEWIAKEGNVCISV